VALVASTMVLARAGAVGRQTPRARPESAGLSAAHLRDATDLLNRYVSEHRIAGAVAAVARRSQVAYLEAVGVQDLETRAPMTERSLFRIYSMTKPVTAVAVMMLHEQRRFALDDAVATFIPEFKNVVVSAEPAPHRARRRGRSPSGISCFIPPASTIERPRYIVASRCGPGR
jgi:CubicO group peptidase (beta-lactamase class C family)